MGRIERSVKLPAHRAGLPGKVIFFHIVPLEPAYKAGLAGHVPVMLNLVQHLTKSSTCKTLKSSSG